MSSIKHIEISLTITMLSDFHIGSGTSISGMADRAVIRAANKELFIPGSTIKGRARHHCEQLARTLGLNVCGGRAANSALCKDGQPPCLICRLFGSEWRPGTLRFSDARLTESLRDVVRHQGDDSAEFDYQVVTHTRTRMNRILRRVEEKALYSFEEGTEGLTFEGRVLGPLLCVETEAAGVPLEALALLSSLSLIESLGGKKTIGLGDCEITVNSLTVDKKASALSLRDVIGSHLEELVLYDDYRSE